MKNHESSRSSHTAEKMDNAVYMIDAQGNRKELLDIGKVVDGLKFSRKSAEVRTHTTDNTESNTEIIQKHIEDSLEGC